MATLFIEQFGQLNGPLTAKQTVAVGATSAQSAALAGASESVVCVVTSDVPCQFEIGANPTAGAASRYLPADLPRAVQAVAGQKVAVIEKQ